MKFSHVLRSKKIDLLTPLFFALVLMQCVTSCDKNRKELITEKAEKYLSDSLKQKVNIISVDSVTTWRFDEMIADAKAEIDTIMQNQQKIDEAVLIATRLYNLETGNFILEVYNQAKPMLQKDLDKIKHHYENMYKHKDLLLITYEVTYSHESDVTYKLFITCDKDYKTFSYQKDKTLGSLMADFPSVYDFVDNNTAYTLMIAQLNSKHSKLLNIITQPYLYLDEKP